MTAEENNGLWSSAATDCYRSNNGYAHLAYSLGAMWFVVAVFPDAPIRAVGNVGMARTPLGAVQDSNVAAAAHLNVIL